MQRHASIFGVDVNRLTGLLSRFSRKDDTCRSTGTEKNRTFGERVAFRERPTLICVTISEVSTAQSGGRAPFDVAVGAEQIRRGLTTAETTASNLLSHGISQVGAVSSGVYTLDPPFPAIEKIIVFGSTANTSYVKTANGETFISSQGTTFSVFKSTNLVVGVVKLFGMSTSVWAVDSGMSTATFALSTTT
jgi:hypothetical protein